MQLIYLVDILKENYNIVLDRFETDSVNFVSSPVAKKQRKFQYILASLSLSEKPWKLLLGTTTLKSFVSHTGLWQTLEKPDDLEKYWANATCNS